MLLENKVGVVLGVANKFSIAYGIAKRIKENGGKVVLSYLNEKFKSKIEPIAKELDADLFELDVTSPETIENFFNNVKKKYEKIDFLVHSIAFANKDDLKGRFYNISKQGFLNAMEVSAYSLIEVSKAALPLMKEGGSILALTYDGSTKVYPSYSVMGVAKAALEAIVKYLAHCLGEKEIRVNAISAGPVNTISARGISGFSKLLDHAKKKAPLKRNVTIEDIGNAATFLVSDLASSITGEILYVDSGMNIMGI